jgi:hypothetical protein
MLYLLENNRKIPGKQPTMPGFFEKTTGFFPVLID